MKRRAILALAVSLAVFVTFGYGFNPNMTTNLVTVGQLDAIESRYVTASDAVVWTDRTDYLPGEVVPIYGSGFLADSTIEINVTRPDDTIESGSALSDSIGYFVYNYDLNGIEGEYNVTAADGVNFASTLFTDGAEVILGYRLPSGEWKESNLAPQKDYAECDWVPYQLIITSGSPAWNDLTNGFVADGSIDIGWKFMSDSKDAIFVDMLGAFYYKFDTIPLANGDPGSATPFDLGFDELGHPLWKNFTPALLNRPGVINSGTGLYDEVPEDSANPNKEHFMRFTPGIGGFPAKGNFTTEEGHSNIVIYYQAHLSLDALWRNGQEAKLPTELAGTLYLGPDKTYGTEDDWESPHHGSSFAPGASTNFKLVHKTAGKKTVSIPIAAYPTGTIEGYKFNDLNGNGAVVGEDEPVIPGWGINGTAEIQFMPGLSVTFLLEHLTTDENGFYNYTGIIEGNYTIEEEARNGWTLTGHSLSGVDGEWDPEEGEVSFEIDVAGTIVRLDFYNTQFGKISGYKWHDLNGDGVWDIGPELGLDGWTIQLRNATTDEIIATAITGAGEYDDGYYNFTHVLPGDYILTEVLQDGWANSASPSGFTLSPGDDLTNKNFGNFMSATLGGYKYDDLDGDGVPGTNTGFDEWTINLWEWSETISDWEFVTTTSTHDGGYYEFSDLEPGLYKINETLLDGWISTFPSPAEYEIPVTSGLVDLDNDFYNFKLATVIVYKYEDADGSLSSTDWTAIDWDVTLTNDSAIIVSLGSDGCYVFTGQEPGSVTVTEDLDSAWYPLNATSWTMDMESGKTYIVRFVNFKKASKSGYKWHDLNGNGIWECDEPAMDGWTINLYQEIDSEWVFLRLAVTGLGEWPDGYYNFSGLEPGEYKVNETLETGWTRTYPISGEYTFTATSGFVELNNNFGNFKWFTISGYKYEYFEGFSDNFDELDFETWSKSEEDNSWWLTPEGWLYSDGTTEWARIFADPTMSLNDYVFEVDVNLIRGSGWEVLFRVNDENYYSLQYEAHCGAVLHLRKYTGSSFEELDQPVSFAPDYDWHHIKVRVLEGYIRIHIDGVLVFNVTDTTDPYLSGGIGLGVLEDARAYFDNVRVLPIVNVLEGWTINLYRDGSLIPYATDTTDEFGFYNFTVEDPGHYTVAEVLLPDWSAVLPVLHIPEISGEEVAGYSIDAISGKNISCRDFWNFKWFTITVEKFQDITGNGILGDDPHLGGWTFYLDNGTIVTSHSDEDENGIVEIDIKRPGSYILTEDLQYGWTQTGTESYPFNAESGMITDPFIFLNFKNVDITVCKLEDANGNLESTDDQEPVSGWTVYLYKDDGAEPIDTQETTCCGCYTWENLGPGSYRVEELVPWGWTALTLISHEFGRVESGESYRFDFINFKWFTVTVYKYEDRTGDGYSDDDTLLSGWTFYLDDGTTKLPFDDEDDGFIDGIASILVTQPGHYEVTEQLEDDYTQTGIEIYEFDAKSGIDVGAEDPDRFIFTNFKWFKIWGHKYEDWDGTQESTERPLDGWRIELWIYNEDLGYYIFKEPTMTAENPEVAGDYGYYEFLVMEPGKYQIKEVLEIGWVETAPMSAYGPGPVLGYDLGLVISGVDLENKDFWNAGLRTYITDTSDCRNIVTDFRLVVTPDFKTGEELYKVSATNPGGFYFNFIFHSWTDDEMKIYFDLAEEFIVKGGQPIHAYIWTDANSNGLVDWCDDELEGIHKNKLIEIDYGEGFIIFEDIEPCNDILVTIHMSFNKKEYQSKEKEWFEDNLLGKGYEFKAHVDGSWSSTTTLTETSEEVKKLKACAVYGIVLEEADDDVPVSGASFSLYKDETLLKSMTTGDDGIFYFDKLDEGTYTLGIELPLGLILQDEKYSGTVIYLSIQIKLQKGDFIFAYVFIRTDAADPGEDPYVTTSMEHINIPESSSSSSYPGNHRDPFRDPEDYDYGVVVEPVLEQKVASSNLEIPILLTWFASVFSLASIFTARKIRRKGASKLYQIAEWDIGFECTFQNSEKQLEWAFEKDGSNLEPGWEKRFAWIRDCSRQLSFNPFIDEEDDNSSK